MLKTLWLAVLATMLVVVGADAQQKYGPAVTGATIGAMSGLVDVRAYGAACNYNLTSKTGADDTTAINAATAVLQAQGYGSLYSPPGQYCYHTGVLNFTNLNSASGSFPTLRTSINVHLVCNNPGGTCVDAIGSKKVRWDNFELLTPNA